ncbi:MAG: DegT/DnrJ/EryC1/StrS aminotransferase family protein [Crocinitomicaceae bacterium]|nr:DegT/DnrJ/EryC1/StrS aminotransferase family protein [Crocinitomicaceae bacterium]
MIPFSPPRIDQKIIDEVSKALLSGWITTGPRTKLFEQKISEYCKCKKTIAVNSWTNGMEVLLRWWGIGPGDEVIIPAYTYCASANVIIHTGAKPVMVDINPSDFNISIENIKSAITNKTKVIMPVDISGLPCDYEELFDLINNPEILSLFDPNNEKQKKLGRILIASDAAHSFGAEYANQKSGSLADITCFSFHAVKNLTTAEGGAICFNLPKEFNHDSIYNEMCIKILHGQSKDALSKTKKGGWKYDVVEPGYKCNMTDIQAAIGLVELERYQENLQRRMKIFHLYDEGFKNKEWAITPISKTTKKTSSFHLYLLRIKNINEEQRNEIIQHIFDKEVSVNVHFQPLPILSAYKNLGYEISNYPNAWDNYSCEITLPVYYNLSNENVYKVISTVIESVNSVIK